MRRVDNDGADVLVFFQRGQYLVATFRKAHRRDLVTGGGLPDPGRWPVARRRLPDSYEVRKVRDGAGGAESCGRGLCPARCSTAWREGAMSKRIWSRGRWVDVYPNGFTSCVWVVRLPKRAEQAVQDAEHEFCEYRKFEI